MHEPTGAVAVHRLVKGIFFAGTTAIAGMDASRRRRETGLQLWGVSLQGRTSCNAARWSAFSQKMTLGLTLINSRQNAYCILQNGPSMFGGMTQASNKAHPDAGFRPGFRRVLRQLAAVAVSGLVLLASFHHVAEAAHLPRVEMATIHDAVHPPVAKLAVEQQMHQAGDECGGCLYVDPPLVAVAGRATDFGAADLFELAILLAGRLDAPERHPPQLIRQS